MNSRLEALIKRGYSEDVVMSLANFTEDELEYASKKAFEHISRNCTSVKNPQAIFIGGQPGCGKTIMSMDLKNAIKNTVEIGIDNYRMYHPRYLEIENCIKGHWKDRKENINDSPGNDIADFTHLFAGAVTDKLIEMGYKNKYNMILEWGMREPIGPLNCMERLKNEGYNNTVLFVATNKELSYEACNIRSNIMKNTHHIIRKVPKSFHDFCIETLPHSIDVIYEEGYSKKYIDYIGIVKRNGETLWDISSDILPGKVFENYVNDIGNYRESKNNEILAHKSTENEMVGLKNRLNDMKKIIFFIQNDSSELSQNIVK